MASRSTGVIQPDDRSCIASCIAQFLGHTELKNPLQKVGRDGRLCVDDNMTLRDYGCEIEQCKNPEIPEIGSCLVLAVPSNSTGDGHCFLCTNGELWDPSGIRRPSWPNGWTIKEVWEIRKVENASS